MFTRDISLNMMTYDCCEDFYQFKYDNIVPISIAILIEPNINRILIPTVFLYIYIYYIWQGPFGIMRPSSFLIPFVSILVSLSVPNLSPYFSIYLHCDSSLWALSVKGISLSPVPRFSLHCSVFFVLMAFGIGLKSHLFSYSSLYFTLIYGCSLWVLQGHSMLLVLCLSPCLSPLFSPTHALTSLSLSLSCCSSL